MEVAAFIFQPASVLCSGTHLPMKEDVKPDIKKLIKFEVTPFFVVVAKLLYNS